MLSLILTSAFAALALAAPRPQDIDFAGVDRIPDPTYTIVPGLASTIVPYNPAAAIASAAAQVTAVSSPQKRGNAPLAARVACAPEPTSDNTYNVDLSSADAFRNDAQIASVASSASAPSGYNQGFSNLKVASQANGYLGYTKISSYNPAACASECSSIAGCLAFNIFFERDPVVEPGAGCTNPNATANIKCAYWGGPVTTDTATYNGTLRSSFQVAIAGSNGYTTTAYQTCAGYTGPTYLGTSAMNAPLDCNGKDTYMGYKLFIDTPFDPRLCSAACDAQTAYNFAYPPSDGTKPKACTFFNTYLLSKNGINQGQYCSMYTQAWSTKYATNDGQWRGTDHYTISYSFSFGNSTNSGNPVCPSDISYLQSSGSAFCTSYIGYTPPAVTQSVTQTKLVTVTAAATAFAVTTPAASTVTTTVFGKTITAYVRKRQATADAVDPEYSIAVETVRMTDTEKAAEYASLTAAPASATGAASDTTASSDTISVSDTTITSDTAASSDTIFVSDTTITSALSPTSDTSSTSTSDAVQRRAIATPAAITSWTPSQISSACSLVATGKTTVTVTSSTVTVTAATQTVVQTVYSGAPRPVTTVTTTVTSTYHLPAVYPTAIAGGANTLVSFDDDYFALTLPFAIGLYGTYSKSVFLSVNGFLSMTAPQLSSVDHALPVHTTTNRTTYLPDITAAPFWNDLFINPSLSQGIYYRITGLVGSRVVFFEYIVGSHDFPLADMYSNNYFTMTFYEDRPGYVFFNYQFINGNGVGATVGVQKASTNQFLQYSSNQAIVTVPMYLVIDTVAGTLVLNG